MPTCGRFGVLLPTFHAILAVMTWDKVCVKNKCSLDKQTKQNPYKIIRIKKKSFLLIAPDYCIIFSFFEFGNKPWGVLQTFHIQHNILFYLLWFCCWFFPLSFFFLIHSAIYWIFSSLVSPLLHYLLLFTDKHFTPGRQAPLISIKTWSFSALLWSFLGCLFVNNNVLHST